MATYDSKFFYLSCILDFLRRSWTNCALVLFFWTYEGAGEKEIRPLLSNARYCSSTFGLSSSKAVPFPSPVLLLLQLHLTLFSCLGRERRREREKFHRTNGPKTFSFPPFPYMRRDLNFPLSENPPLPIFGCISNAHTTPYKWKTNSNFFHLSQGASGFGDATLETETEVIQDDVDIIWVDTLGFDQGYLYATTNRYAS